MKIPCVLESIEQNKATLYDFKNDKELSVILTEEERTIYSELLERAKDEEIEDEAVDPIVFYDTTTNSLSSVTENESNFFN